MPSAYNFELPRSPGGLLAWAIANPQAHYEAFDMIRKLSTTGFKLVTAVGPSTTEVRPQIAADNATVGLPLRFNRTLADPSSYAGGTAGVSYSQSDMQAVMTQLADLSTKYRELLGQLRATGQNPS